MSSNPEIKVEDDYGSVDRTTYGSFNIDRKSVWLPFYAEKGVIKASADRNPLPSLKVRALGNDRMELSNTRDFAIDRLNGVDFFINDQPLQEGSSRNKEMSCSARIKSVVYSGGGTAMTYTCTLTQKGKKRRKNQRRKK